MTAVSANDIVKTHYCKHPGCESEVRSPVGRYSYCTEHQGTTKPASRNGSATQGGAHQALRDLLSLAKGVDKAKAKADRLRRAANDADKAADSLEASYREALTAATRVQ